MSPPRRADPPPLETDDVKIVAGGTAAWALAAVGLVLARLAGSHIHAWWIAMCVSGAVLGLMGVRYCQRRRLAIGRARGEDGAAEHPG